MSYAGRLVMEPNDKEPVKSTQVGPDIKRPNCSYRAIVHSMCFRHVSVRRSFRLMRCEKLTPLWFNVRAWKVNYAEAIMWRQLMVLPSSAHELLLPIHKAGGLVRCRISSVIFSKYPEAHLLCVLCPPLDRTPRRILMRTSVGIAR